MRKSLSQVEQKKQPDDKDKQEETLAQREQAAKIDTIKEQNEDLKANRDLRWKYARWVYSYLVGYSVFVAVVLLLSGFRIKCFSLDGAVLEFLVGSTAVSAIGLVLAVTTGLFKPASR